MDAVSCSDFFCYLLSKTTTKKHVLSTKQEKFVFFLNGNYSSHNALGDASKKTNKHKAMAVLSHIGIILVNHVGKYLFPENS